MLAQLQLNAGDPALHPTAPHQGRPPARSDIRRPAGDLAIGNDERNTIALYAMRIGDILQPGLLRSYERLLRSEERVRYEQFCFERDRRRFLITRALARTVLSRYTCMQPETLVFCTGAYGRPELESSGYPGPPLRFNLSHTNSLVVLAVTFGRAIGVDVEAGSQAQLLHHAQRHMLSPLERERLGALPPAQRDERLLALWTLKAYTKARGLQLALPFGGIIFDLSRDLRLSASFDSQIGDDPACWNFCLLKASADHVISLSVKRDFRTRPSLRTYRVIPLVSEEPCVLSLLRASYQ